MSQGERITVALGLGAAVLTGITIAFARPAPATPTAHGGRVTFAIPAGFVQATADEPKAVARGLGLDEPATYRNDHATGGGLLVVGEAHGSGAKLLPRGVHAGDASAMALGEYIGVRVENVVLPGVREQVTVFAMPTTKYIANVVCVAGTDADRRQELDRGCAHAAATMSLGDAKPIGDGARDRYQSALATVVQGYSDDAARSRQKLANAETATDQADAADAMHDVATQLRGDLAGLPPDPYQAPRQQILDDALAGEAKACGALARAARRGNGDAYALARENVVAAHGAVRRAIAALAKG